MRPAGQRVRMGQALIVLTGVLFVALIGRLVYIQTVLRPELSAWSEQYQFREIVLPGRRGAILDRRQRVLAGSRESPTVYADPLLVGDHAEAAEMLAPALNLTPGDVQKLLDKPTSPRYVVLKRHLTPMEAEAVKALGLDGIGLQNEPARTYPMGELAAQVVGFVSSDGGGLDGLELAWERHLRAVSGKRIVHCDAGRRAVFSKPDSFIPPKNGLHIVLTIDAAIQEIVERELAKQVQARQAESGVVLLLNPQNGEVLAMANYPSFDPSTPNLFPVEHRRNRILTDPAEPGSIFKPFVMCAALAEKLARPEEIIDCERGAFRIGKRILHDVHSYSGLTVAQIMIKSSNIGMAKLGLRLGNEKMHSHLSDFGFGQPTGIDLHGENHGIFMPLRRWNSYTTTSVPMGQEMAPTPLQLGVAFSAIVNGGRLYQPRVVRAVIDKYGNLVEDHSQPVFRGQVIDPEVSADVCDMLKRVVSSEGTGRACIMDRWEVLGKTGTAQVPARNRRGYEPGAYLASFMAAAPASDPAVVAVVMIRKPKGAPYYGGTVAAPVAKAIFEQVLPYLNVPPDKPDAASVRLAKGGASGH
ncbi:MAG: penicillin-binding protein 2 [Phycisphaerales bacterium]|nr:penicillin-binding protein 2 [Phycisphaerales bacterium]